MPIDGPMKDNSARFLAGYLIFATVVSGYLVFALWSAAPQTPAAQPPSPTCAAGARPSLTHVQPARVNAGSAAELWLGGCGFTADTAVKLNGAPHKAVVVDAKLIRVDLTIADVAAAGTVVVGVFKGEAEVGSGSFTAGPPAVKWGVFGGKNWDIAQEAQLLLMVLLTGAFGACIYGLKSLADYRGDQKLCESWFLFYVVQPFEGAGIAFLLYMVIRGGFLAGTGADVNTVNQFGVCAIAGLAGAFSDIAFLKLREVFQTLFKPRDDRGDKIGPKITTTSLPAAVVGEAYKQALQASGGTAPLKWSVNPALPAGLSLDAATGEIAGTPTEALQKKTYKITVTDSGTPASSNSAEIQLEVKVPALKVVTTALPAAEVAKPYKHALEAAHGTAPLKWAASPDLPLGLELKADGTIEGAPQTPGESSHKFTVTDSAATAASATAELKLKVKPKGEAAKAGG
jgi:hypothetical protein